MPSFTVRYRRPDGTMDARRVQATCASAARAEVEARGRTVLSVDGEDVALDLDEPRLAHAPSLQASPEMISILRSIDVKLGAIQRSKLVRSPSHTIGWAVVGAIFVCFLLGLVSAFLSLLAKPT